MKGLLSTEGILGHHEVFRSREALTDDLRRYVTFSNPRTKVKSQGRGENAAPAKVGEARGWRRSATRVSETRSHSAPWEENAHAHDEGREAPIMRSVLDRDPSKRFERRETFGPPVMPFGA